MKWYYVNQKLPEKDGFYLCYTEDGFYVLCKFSNNLYDIDGFDLCDGDKRGFYRGNSTVGYHRYNALRCWAHLPEPPSVLRHDPAKQALVDEWINEKGVRKFEYKKD